MKTKLNIYFCTDDGERFFGEGPYRLLEGIVQLGSLSAAAQRMGMGYTKAFKIMKRAEACFGFALTCRHSGGSGGGGSVLTPAAKELMMRYEAYTQACHQQAENLYNTHFSTFRPSKPADNRGPGGRQDRPD